MKNQSLKFFYSLVAALAIGYCVGDFAGNVATPNALYQLEQQQQFKAEVESYLNTMYERYAEVERKIDKHIESHSVE